MNSISGYLDDVERNLYDSSYGDDTTKLYTAIDYLRDACKVLAQNIEELNKKLEQVISYTGQTFYDDKH